MIGRNIFACGALAACAGAMLPAVAEARNGWYLGGEFGGNFVDDQTFDGSNFSFDAGFGDDVLFGINVGYALPSGWRPEFAIDFRSNDVDSLSAQGNSTTNVSGHEDADTFMGNIWYDFKLPQRQFRRFHPHVGAGIGLAQVGVHGLSWSQPPANIFSVDDDQTLFAYQFGAGVAYDLAPNWIVSADFRYLATTDGDFHYSGGPVSGTFNSGYSAESLLVAVRYEFGPRFFR
jgi:opacity protein-like surface antigen